MTQPHQIDREAVALWGCADGNGVDPRLVFHDKATADQVAADTDMVVRPLYTDRSASEAVAWREGRDWSSIRNLFVREAERFISATRYEEASAIADAAARDILALIATHPVQALDSSLRDTHRAAVTDVLADCPGCGVAPLRLHKADCEIMLSRTPASDTTGGYEAAGQRSEPKSTHPVQGGEG